MQRFIELKSDFLSFYLFPCLVILNLTIFFLANCLTLVNWCIFSSSIFRLICDKLSGAHEILCTVMFFFFIISISDAIRTVQHTPHNLSGACLSVSLCEEFEEETADDSEVNTEDHEEKITIIVSGISASTTEDAVCNYFKNSRRSGGGDVHKIDHKVDGDTVITFLEVKGMLITFKPI